MLSRLWQRAAIVCGCSATWAGMYIAAIVVYAFIYQTNGDAFHQSTALADAKTREVVHHLEAKMGSLFDDALSHTAPAYGATARLTDATPSELSFVVSYRLSGSRSAPLRVKRVLCTVAVPLDSDFTTDIPIHISDPDGDFLWRLSLAVANPENRGHFGELYVKSKLAQTVADTPGKVDVAFCRDDAFVRFAEQYQRAARGIPEQEAGSWWRWVYLSSVTITTLGYGDVVPLTDGARLLVSSEAVFGVVIAGLFLNGVASGIGKRRGATA